MRPVNVHDEVDDPTSQTCPSELRASYSLIATPPLESGVDQRSVIEPSDASTESDVGEDGTAAGVAGADATDAEPDPYT